MSTNTDQHSLGSLAAAYTAAWGEINNVVKNAENPHFKSNYADLGAVLDTVRGVFQKHGLALLQSPGRISEVGGMLMLHLVGVLFHASGQNVPLEMMIPIGPAVGGAPAPEEAGPSKFPKKGGGKVDAQKTVAATTYARRVQLAAVAGIAQVDDDGNEAADREADIEAEEAEALKKEIAAFTGTAKAFAGTNKEPSAIRQRVEALGNAKVVDAYIAKRDELKAKDKGSKE